MARLGYSHIPVEGFLSLAEALEKGAWGAIDIQKFLDGGHSPLEASQAQGWKLRLTETTRVLAQENAPLDDKTPLVLDSEWDQLQRELNGEIYAHTARRDLTKRAAALRLREHFLLGGGTGQTNLTLEKEIDWGRMQVQLSKQALFQQDIQLLELTTLFQEIEKKTDELAERTGHGSTESLQYRSQRIRIALVACQQAADAVAAELSYLSEHTNCTADEKANLAALLASLTRTAERYQPAPERPAAPVVGQDPTPES